MQKSPAVAFFMRKMKTTPRTDFIEEIKNAPFSCRDKNFIFDLYDGLSITELAARHNKSASRIAQWKRDVSEKMLDYEIANNRKQPIKQLKTTS